MNYLDAVKYPKTYHFDFSDSLINDDRELETIDNFIGKRVIVSEKMDGENCLRDDVKIMTNLGELTIKNIVDNKIKCKVLSYNEYNGELEFKNIKRYYIYSEDKNDDWYEIELETGHFLYITGNHQIYLPDLNCYRRVVDLTENDNIYLKI